MRRTGRARRGRAVLDTGRREDEATRTAPSAASRRRSRRRLVASTALVSVAAAVLGGCGTNGGLPDSATTQGDEVISLWTIFLTLATIVAALIWILVIGTIVASVRRRRQHERSGEASRVAATGDPDGIIGNGG